MTVLTGPPQVKRLASGGSRAGERDQLARIPLDLWHALAGDQDAQARYYSKGYWRGPRQYAFFLGAVSSGGRGRLRLGTDRAVADLPASLVVPSDVYGYGLS